MKEYNNNSNENNDREKIIEQLTNQELKVLKLASKQFSNKEIANELFIVEATVKKHRENVCKKLSIKGKTAMRTFLRSMASYFK